MKYAGNGKMLFDPTERKLSRTEDCGVRLAVALSIKEITGFPFILVEDGHIPAAAMSHTTGTLEV